jgi:hypothetical protein
LKWLREVKDANNWYSQARFRRVNW